jgi:hypothetical protein
MRPPIAAHAVRIRLKSSRVNAVRSSSRPVGVGLREAVSNYITSQAEVSGVPHFNEARLVNVLPGVSARYYEDAGRFRYDLILAPGANPGDIALNYEGAEQVAVGPDGTVQYRTRFGWHQEAELLAYQTIAGERKAIPARFMPIGRTRVGVALGEYDASQPVVIDPVILTRSTMFGPLGGGSYLTHVANHPSGEVVYAGRSFDPAYPVTPGAYQVTNPSDAGIVTRLRATLDQNSVRFSTYIGQSIAGVGGVAVFDNGTIVYGISTTATDLPTSAGAYVASGIDIDAYIIRLSGDLGTRQAATYVTGTGADWIEGIAVNSISRHVAFAMTTQSGDLETVGPAANAYAGHRDIYWGVLGRNFTELRSASYAGGSLNDDASSVAYGRNFETLVVAGHSESTDFVATNKPLSGDVSTDALILRAKLGMGSTGGSTLAAVRFGGDDFDTASDIVVDGQDRIISAGTVFRAASSSEWSSYPKVFGHQNTLSAEADNSPSGWIGVFASDLASLARFTYFRPNANLVEGIAFRAIEVQPNGTVHVAGTVGDPGYTNFGSSLSNLPFYPANEQDVDASNQLLYCRFSNGLRLISSTSFGGNSTDYMNDFVLRGSYSDAVFAANTGSDVSHPTYPLPMVQPAGSFPYDSYDAGGNDTPYFGVLAFSTDPISLTTNLSAISPTVHTSCRIDLNAPVVAPGGQNVTFTTNNPSAVRLPGGQPSLVVNIPPGSSSASIKILGRPVAAPTPVTISATSSGTTVTRTITVNP